MERLNLTRQGTGEITAGAAGDGAWQVWEQPLVRCRYLLSVRGGGAAVQIGGRQERERSVILVLRKWWERDNGTVTPTRLVARLFPPVLLDPTPLAELVVTGARWFGGALCFVEVKKNDTALVAKECQRLGAAVQVREVLDKANSTFAKELGWQADADTEPAALNALVNAVRETGAWLKAEGDEKNAKAKLALVCECQHAVRELETFAGGPDTPRVSHEDDVRALATGLYNIDAATLLHPEAARRVVPQGTWKEVDSF